MTIPKSQFHVFVVTNKSGSALGVYQTFGKAYEAISRFVKGNKLIEIGDKYNVVEYADYNNPSCTYSVTPCLFTYDSGLPLVDLFEARKEMTALFSQLV